MLMSSASFNVIVFLGVIVAMPLSAQTIDKRLSSSEKCDIYKSAFETIMQKSLARPLSESFVTENHAFIKSECLEYGFVCPRSLADLAAANEITLIVMNKGLASTFLPFKCPKPQ